MKNKEAKKKSDLLKIAQGLGIVVPISLLPIGNIQAMNSNIMSDEVVVGDMMSVHKQNPISYNGCGDDCDCIDSGCDTCSDCVDRGCNDGGCTDRCVDCGDTCTDCADTGCNDNGCSDRCVDNCDK